MKRFFLFCSGANLEVLKECPTEESKYVGIGATIALTSVLATLTGGYALFTVFRSVPLAIPLGILWGLVIFNLDRVIVSGMRKQKHAALDLVYAAPRLGISVLLALVISAPLELKLFDVEIREKWALTQLTAQSRDVERIRDIHGDRLAELRGDNARLRSEVDAKRSEYKAATDAWISEKEGTAGTGIPGAGSVFAEKEAARQEIARQLRDVETRNLPRIEKNEAEIARIVEKQDRKIDDTDAVRADALGFLARLEAFGALKRESRTIFWASLLITFLFISLETAPVMVKVLSTFSPYRPYDELLEQREFRIVERVRQQVRLRRHKLKAGADRMMHDYSDVMGAELHLSSERNQLRVQAELRGNETLIKHIADAQAELAGEVVDEWKRRELETIRRDAGAYVQTVPQDN